ncbi:hypothetical protein [Acaryochloris marina]|nr:hypothetical protein [Acaryochloris marina]
MSGRLLSEKYVFNKIKNTNGESLTYSKWFEKEETVEPEQKLHLNKLHAQYSALKYIPRIIGLLPTYGLLTGIYKVNRYKLYIDIGELSDSDLFALIWLAMTGVILFCLNQIIFYRRDIINIIKENLLLNKNEVKKKSLEKYENQILFNPVTEFLVITPALICFIFFTMPTIANTSGSYSFQSLFVFITCLIFNIFLYLFNKNKIKCISSEVDKKKKLIEVNLLLISRIVITLLVFLLLVPKYSSVKFIVFIGPISITALCLGSFSVIFSNIYYWGYSTPKEDFRYINILPGEKIPTITLIIILALISSQFNWNDNHQIRHIYGIKEQNKTENSKKKDIVLSIPDAFDSWIEKRNDKNKYIEKNIAYPVYIVSAQGGGIYAAYHAASTLAKLHDTSDGKFSSHVFAISSVSGGSLGSAVYSALVKEFAQQQNKNINSPTTINVHKKISPYVEKILGNDFLSPLFSLALFPDLLQRFIPIPISTWDRVRGLELALEEYWDNTFNASTEMKNYENYFSNSYKEFWNLCEENPALVLNTTNVETGERVVFSPFKFSTNGLNSFFDFDLVYPNIPLSTATFISARFPIFTPAGWFKHYVKDETSATKRISKSRLVDGGYFDNSGVATARDIIDEILEDTQIYNPKTVKKSKEKVLRISLINIALVDSPDTRKFSDASHQGLNEILSPLRTVVNVRNSRANSIIEQAEDDLNTHPLAVSNIKKNKNESNMKIIYNTRFIPIYLDNYIGERATLPLGWLLSKNTRMSIDTQIPEPDNDLDSDSLCKSDESDSFVIEKYNFCISEEIKNQLQ